MNFFCLIKNLSCAFRHKLSGHWKRYTPALSYKQDSINLDNINTRLDILMPNNNETSRTRGRGHD